MAKLAARAKTPRVSGAMYGNLLSAIDQDSSPEDIPEDGEPIRPGAKYGAGGSPDLRDCVTVRRLPANITSRQPPGSPSMQFGEASFSQPWRLDEEGDLPQSSVPITGVKRPRALAMSTRGSELAEALDLAAVGELASPDSAGLSAHSRALHYNKVESLAELPEVVLGDAASLPQSSSGRPRDHNGRPVKLSRRPRKDRRVN